MKNLQQLWSYLDSHVYLLYGLTFLLAIVALFANLGMLPLLADEPTRAVVALEMMYSDNYWVPTLYGENYYNKPPFYNWLILGLFQLTGSFSEWVIRLPSAIPFLLYCLTIFFGVRKYTSDRTAFLAAGMFFTCGRLLVYASLLGHIDLFYSWLVFISFLVFIQALEEKNWWKFYLVTYLVAAVTFLCKGLPTVVFQGFTIIALLLYTKQFKRFFTLQHLCGILLFSVLVGGYFYMYNLHQPVEGWTKMWSESTQRTAIDQPWYSTISNIIKFPLEHLYHLAPWSLFMVFLWKKETRVHLWNNKFLKLMTIILAVNIPVYWLSPGYFPRYLFMLYPIVFLLLAEAYFFSSQNKAKNVLHIIFKALALIVAAASLVGAFIPDFYEIAKLKFLVLTLLALVSFMLIHKLTHHVYIGLVFLFVVAKLAFNSVGVPIKAQTGRDQHYKEDAEYIAKKSLSNNLHIMQWTPINHNALFYIERTRGEILSPVKDSNLSGFYLAEKKLQEFHRFTILDSMTVKYQNQEIYLVKK